MSDAKPVPDYHLEPCPFCGRGDMLNVVAYSEMYFEEDDGSPECWAVNCDASNEPGHKGDGCGATSGYRLSKDEAVAAWNQRSPSGWISVEERSPQDGHRVLVHWSLNYDFIEPAIWHHEGYFVSDDSDGHKLFGVTHWTPLPAPPTPQSKDGLPGAEGGGNG